MLKLFSYLKKIGATARIRTWDPNIRSVVFYPAELRSHMMNLGEVKVYRKYGPKSRIVWRHSLIW